MRGRLSRPRQRARAVVLSALVSLAMLAPAAPVAGQGPRIEGPLTLERAVELAREKSLKVKIADADARVMDSMRREALAPFFPQLSANGYFAEQRMAPNVYTSAGTTMARNYQVFGADQTRDANLTAMYPLFSGGRDWYGYKAAAARADAAREMLAGTRLDAATQARLDYAAALREVDGVGVTEALIRDIEERLRVSREQLAAGRVARFYVLRDEAELANARQMEAMARSRAEAAMVALKATLGVDLASPITLADRLEPVLVDATEEAGPRPVLETHPELRAAARQREATLAEVRAAYGGYFPQVSVGYMYDWGLMRNRAWESQADGMRSRTDSAEGYSVGVVVTLPLFDGFMRENALRTARARADKAAHTEALVRQQLEKEATQARLMLRAARASVEASRQGLAQAEEEFRVVRERYESGRGIQLEILDAQVTLTRARFNAVAALADYAGAHAMWLRATGEAR